MLTKLFVLILVSAVVVSATKEDCVKLAKEADESVKDLLFIGKEVKVPHDESQLGEYCSMASVGLRRIKAYSKCLQDVPLQIIKILLGGLNRVKRAHCDKKVDKTKILNKISCADENTVKSIHKCISPMSAQFTHISSNAATDKIFPFSCCTLHLLTNCVHSKISSNCGKDKVKSKEAADYITEQLDEVVQNIAQFACGKLKSVQECDKKIGRDMKDLRKIGDASSKGVEPDNFIIEPLVKTVERLME